MDELTALLDREAGRVSAQPGAIETTIARGRRRARRARLATITLALVLAAGSFAGLMATFGGGGSAEPAAGGWAGIWPQTSLQSVQAAQAGADAGDPTYTWQLDATTVLQRFGLEQLGWKGFSFLRVVDGSGSDAPGYNNEPDLSNPDASGPLTFMILGCDATGPGVSCPTATVTIQRLLRQDRTGIWSVTQVEDQGAGAGVYSTAARSASG
jgi:hypothetical protein